VITLIGVAREQGGGQVGACTPERWPWRRNNTLYSDNNILYSNVFFSRNLGQNMPKNAYFSSGGLR